MIRSATIILALCIAGAALAQSPPYTYPLTFLVGHGAASRSRAREGNFPQPERSGENCRVSDRC
jgi:hypothetical protein